MMSVSAMLNQQEKQYPEENDGCLDCGGVATSCAFNRFGTLLAVGCRDGRIVLWDLLTRGITRTFHGHSFTITKLSWSRNGHYLASGSKGGMLYIWDIAAGERCYGYHFASALTKVQFHPRSCEQVLVCIHKQLPVTVNITTDLCQPIPDSGENVVAAYNRRGDKIITGNNRGMVTVFESDTFKELLSVRVTTSLALTQIKSIEFCAKRNIFLVSSSDRVIRLFDADTLPGGSNAQAEPACLQRMQDLVNRTMWKSCHFSADGEYVVAACSREHFLHIYETCTGSVVKILKGLTGEDLWDVAWHPLRPMITSVCSGIVTVWAHNPVENWSAFAPNFSELEENEEYDERESEFDEEDEDRSERGDGGDQNGEDLDIDVERVDDLPAYLSSDEEADEGNLLSLPVQPDLDEEEEREWRAAHPKEASGSKRKFPDENNAAEEPDAKRLRVVEVSVSGVSVPARPVLKPAPPPIVAADSLSLEDHLPTDAGAMFAEMAGSLPADPASDLPASTGELSSFLSDLLDGDGSVGGFALPQAELKATAPELNLDDFVP